MTREEYLLDVRRLALRAIGESPRGLAVWRAAASIVEQHLAARGIGESAAVLAWTGAREQVAAGMQCMSMVPKAHAVDIVSEVARACMIQDVCNAARDIRAHREERAQ